MTVDPQSLASFRDELATAIDATAAGLRDRWGEYLDSAQAELRDALFEVVNVPEVPPAVPKWEKIVIEDFRAIDRPLTVPLSGATVIEGLNGTGKSSLFEAAEILSTKSSTRKPADASPDTYAGTSGEPASTSSSSKELSKRETIR